MTKIKNNIKLICVFIITIIISCLLVKYSLISIEKIIELADDFQYNIISMSSIIGGFLFTGVGILISAIDKERVTRLWENNYLDNLYKASFIGMISNVVTILSALTVLCCTVNKKLSTILYYVEIASLILGIVFFIWSIKQLIFIISRLKSD